MYRSLRDYIARLEQAGELVRVHAPVSPEYEIAEITDRMCKSPGGGKALLFEHTGTGFPVLTNMMGSRRRMAAALGAESPEAVGARMRELLAGARTPKDSLRERLRLLPLMAAAGRWLPRVVRGRGACQQVVHRDEAASLGRLPVLKCWPCDGGAFVTLPMVHTLDPETGVRNLGMYRMQVLGDRLTGMHWHVHKTGARHFEAYRKLGRRMPVTVTLGGDPVYTFAATAPMPEDMDEYLLAGFLRRRPVRLVRCLTNELCVPADCDFVIEGYVDPAEEPVVEGPFGDHTGFYSLEDRYPRFHVTALTHRRDAVWPATVVGVPPMEDARIAEATERIFLEPIRAAVLPEAEALWMPQSGVAHNLAVVAIRRRYAGQGHKAAQALWGAGQMMFNKYLLLTPAGLDVRDTEILAALVRRADPARMLLLSEGVLDVLDHATATPGFGGKAALDLSGVDPAGPEPALPLAAEDIAVDGAVSIRTDFVARWGAVALFAPRGERIDAAACLQRNGLKGVPYAAVFDPEAAGLEGCDLLWLATANSDPRRDLQFAGGTLVVDARSKRPGREGFPARFPNVACSHPDTIRLVDARWHEYGLGAFLPSPSARYRRLLLSPNAAW